MAGTLPRELEDRPLPHNADAEGSVLAAILLSSPGYEVAFDVLRPDDFFKPMDATVSANGVIFRAMVAMREAGQSIDLTLVIDELTRRNELEPIGGAVYLSHLLDGVPRVSNVERYVAIIKDDAARRLAMHHAEAIIFAGLDRDDVGEIKQRFIQAASAIQPRDERARAVTGKDLLAMDVKPREFLIDGLITTRSMMEIFSWRGVGKTWAALTLGHAVAAGTKFLKWEASRARRVLFVDGELDAASLQQRLRVLGAADENLKILCCDMQQDPFPNLATARAQRMIEDALADGELLILDNLSALAPSSNETEAEDWIAIQSWLLELRRKGIASIFLHHAGHAGWSRGTTRREDLLDLVVELRRPKDYVASEGLRFELYFTKVRGMMGAGAEPIEGRLGTDPDGNLLWTWRDLQDARLAQITELKAAGNSWREIESLTGIPRSTAERVWRNAQEKQKK